MANKNDSIELSPKYGMNAFIPKCFWCGNDRNDIALPGRIRTNPVTGKEERGGDFEAKNGMIIDYTPCDSCKKHWQMGVAMLEATQEFINDRPAIGKDNHGNPVAPTGRWTVIKEESEFAKMNGLKKGMIALIDKNMMDSLIPAMKDAENKFKKSQNDTKDN